MYILNITTQVDSPIAREWVKWQKEIHIPDQLSTGAFFDHRFYQLVSKDHNDGITFVIQFCCHDQTNYDTCMEQQASCLMQKAFLQWGNRFVSFQTLLVSV